MAFATRRVLVLACCVVSVVLAGLMFPATGTGDVPSLGSGSTSGVGPPSGTATPDPGTTDRAATDTPEPTQVRPGDTTTTAGGTDRGTATAVTERTTTTPTPTPTAAPAVDDDRDDAAPVAFLGLPVWVLVGWALLVVTPGVLLEGKYRRWPVFRRLPIPAVSLVSLGQSIPQLTSGVLVDVSGSVARLATGLGTAGAGGSRAFVVLASSLPRGIGRLTVSLPGALLGSIPSLSGFSLFGSSSTSLAAGADAGTGPAGDDERPDPVEEETPPATVEAAWVTMVESLPVGNRETKTPMELARWAVDHGLPSDPVYALTDAFRAVAYGGAAPTEERTDRALSALERVKQALEDEE